MSDDSIFENHVSCLMSLLPTPCKKQVLDMADRYTKIENGSALIDYGKLYGVILEVAEGAGLIWLGN